MLLCPLLFTFVLSSVIYSQSNDEYVGFAQGRNIEAVKISALQNLSQQIQVFISTKTTRNIYENREIFKDSIFTNTIAQSFMSLTDVQEKIEDIGGGEFSVTKSVSKASVQKMFDVRRKRILEYLDEAERLRIEAGRKNSVSLQPMLDNYYQAYLLNAIYLDTLTYAFNSQATSVAVGVPIILDEIARSIQFIPLKQIEDEYIVWKYLVRYNNKEVFHLRYSFFDGMGQSEGEVRNGETQITLYYSKKEKKERQVQVQLEFISTDELDITLSIAKKFLQTSVLQKTIFTMIPGDNNVVKPIQKLPLPLEGLIKAKLNFEEILNQLQHLVKKGIIVQGKAGNFETVNDLYCVVVDKQGLSALLKNTNSRYYDYLTNKEVELKEYAGKRIMWFELLK